MKTLILRKKITSPKIEITLPPDEEIVIKIEKKKRKNLNGQTFVKKK